MVKLITHHEFNFRNLPEQIIVVEDQKTIRQLLAIANKFGILSIKPEANVCRVDIEFDFMAHRCLVARVMAEVERPLSAILAPRSMGVKEIKALFALVDPEGGTPCAPPEFDRSGPETN